MINRRDGDHSGMGQHYFLGFPTYLQYGQMGENVETGNIALT